LAAQDGGPSPCPPIPSIAGNRSAFLPRGQAFIHAINSWATERLPIEVEAMWKSVWDRRISWLARTIIPLCALAYAIAPIDPIPNSLPIIGHLDDVIVAAVLIAFLIYLVPRSILLEHRADAAERRGRRLALNR